MRATAWYMFVALLVAGCGSGQPGASDLSLEEARELLRPGMTTGEFQQHLQTTPTLVSPTRLRWHLDDGELLTDFMKGERGAWIITGEPARKPEEIKQYPRP